ncbi:MAG: hypothetical protein WB609_00930 [Candidatus Cybelea sp.]
MRRILIAAVVVAIISALSLSAGVKASEYLYPDGVWWQSLPEHDKIVAVEGMLPAYEGGIRDSYAYLAAHGYPDSGRFLWAKRPQDFGGRTFGEIVRRIDDVYSSHPNLHSENVSWFVMCAATSGVSCDKTIRWLEKHPNQQFTPAAP